MTVKPIPDGYQRVTPYLTVDGAEKLIDFLKRAFDAEEPGERMPGADGGIGHAQLMIGDSMVMLGDATERNPAMPGALNLYAEDCDDTYNRAIAAGATSLMEPADQFWGDRMAGVRDPVGNVWYISTHIEDVPPEDMGKRAAEWAAQQEGS